MKWLVALLFVIVLATQYRLWVSADGVSEVMLLRESVAAQRGENERLGQRNQQLAAEVRDLKQGYTALEERARSELGMIAGNETFFQVVPSEQAPTATSAKPAKLPTRTASR